MGKFGGLGSFSVGSVKATITNATNKVTNKVNNMSTEEMTNLMEKATVGNAASWLGSKVGINVDAGKVDGVVNRYYELRSSVQSRLLNAVIGTAKEVGYDIKLPDGEKIANYLMDHGVMDKIEQVSGDLTTKDIETFAKSIDIPKVANEIGLSVTKIPKVESKSDAKTLVDGKLSDVASTMSGIGGVIGTEMVGTKDDVKAAVNDIKDIVKGE